MCVDIVYIYECGDRESNQYTCHQNLDGPRFSEQCPNWDGIEYERKEGSCNKCEMSPIPDHQPQSGEDEIFPRSMEPRPCQPTGYHLGAEQWTAQQGTHHYETQKTAVSPQGTKQVGTEQRPKSQRGTHSTTQHGYTKSAHAPMKFTSNSRHAIRDPSRSPHQLTAGQVRAHSHPTTREREAGERACSPCNIL